MASAASVHARLLHGTRQLREDFNLILGRYAVERLLYRLSVSDFAESFVLKGALLFDLWLSARHRPTRDADFLGFGKADAAELKRVFQAVCVIPAGDAMEYDPATVRVMEIREEANYGGLRVTLRGRLGKADSAVQIDVGFGDAVTPGADWAEMPHLLPDQPAPRLRVYPRETVVAEKLDAIVKLGLINSRMKDYFDLRALLAEGAIRHDVLVRAVAATFHRRGTEIPASLPVGLAAEFAEDALKRSQWTAFLRKNRLESPALEDVVGQLAEWLLPVLRQAARLQTKN